MSREWSPWISGFEAAICGGCGGVFSSRDGGCPKACSGDSGWHPVNSVKGRDEIRRLRSDLELARGALLTIANGSGGIDRKRRLAARTLVILTISAGNEKADRYERPAKGESNDQTGV